MSVIITSFFSKNGVPQTGLTPSIRIWEVNSLSHDLLIGTPNGSTQPIDGTMTEIFDVNGDGFYKYEFTDANGFNKTKTYAVRSNGGTSLSIGDRYQVVSISPTESPWDELTSIHNIGGSFGERVNIINSTSQNTAVNVINIQGLLDVLLKYETNRTKIDPIAKTLTVYDDNCTTPLRVFKLLDSNGVPSIDSVCERTPISATDGQPVCL